MFLYCSFTKRSKTKANTANHAKYFVDEEWISRLAIAKNNITAPDSIKNKI